MQYHKEYSYSTNNDEIKCGFLSVIDKKYYVNDISEVIGDVSNYSKEIRREFY